MGPLSRVPSHGVECSCLDREQSASNKRLRVLRLVSRILFIALLALLGAFPGAARALAGSSGIEIEVAPRESGEQAEPRVPAGVSRLDADPAQETESTESLDTHSGDESLGASLAQLPGEQRVVVAASFERAPVTGPSATAPPAVDQDTPTRPPRA